MATSDEALAYYTQYDTGTPTIGLRPLSGFLASGGNLPVNPAHTQNLGVINLLYSDPRVIGKLPFGGLQTIDGIISFETDKSIVFPSPPGTMGGKLARAYYTDSTVIPSATYRPSLSDAVRDLGPDDSVNPWPDNANQLFETETGPTPAPADVQFVLSQQRGRILRGVLYRLTSELA